jgi:O-antigen/teichoic acid export membrane protein
MRLTRLTKNVIFNVLGQGLILVLSLIAVRFIFRRLGDDVFGIIFFNIVMTSVLASVLELGVSSTIVREVSGHFETELDYVHQLIGTATTLYWSMGILLVVVIWFTAPVLVDHWLNLRSIDRSTAVNMLRLLSAMSLTALPRSLYASLFRGRQLMGLNNAIDVGTAAAQQLGILLILGVGGGVYLVVAWISTSVLLGVAAYIVVASRIVGWPGLRPSFSAAVVTRNVGFTRHMMLISLLSLVHIQAAQVIVSKLLPVAVFGFYGFTASTVSRASVLTSAIAQAAFPSFSKLYASGDRSHLLHQYRKLQDLVCFATLPLFTGLCFAATPVYTYVFSARVADQLLLPTAFLALGTWMNATLNMPYTLSLAMGRPQIAARQNLYALAVVLPATMALIYRFGLAGAGFSWVVYHLFAYAYMIPRICRECLGGGLLRWYLDVLKVLGLAALTYGPAWLLVGAAHTLSPLLVLAYAAASVGFALGAFLLIGPELRATALGFRRTLAVTAQRAKP